MRLTLRTLLAWIDGLMPSEEAEEFGQKVDGSQAAKTIVERIRAIVVHPGIDAPRIDGRGLGVDANSVSEYLTNGLPPDAVATFERVCLESDVHLAEVASVHRLLAEGRADDLILLPPDPATRDRLLAAISSNADTGETSETPLVGTAPIPRPTLPSAIERGAVAGRENEASPRSGGAWAMAAAAVILLGTLVGLLLWKLAPPLPRGLPPSDTTAEPMAAPAPAAAVADSQPAPALAARANDEKPQGTAVATDAEPASPPVERATATAARTPAIEGSQDGPPAPKPAVADAVASPAATAEPEVSRVPGGEALAIAAGRPKDDGVRATGRGVATPTGPPGSPAAEEPAASAPCAVVEDGFVIARGGGEVTADRRGWTSVVAAGGLESGATIVAPAGVRPLLRVGGIVVRLEPSSCAVVSTTGEGSPRIELVFGRMVVGGLSGDQRVAVRAGGLEGIIAGPCRSVGIEVSFGREPGSDPLAASARKRSVVLLPTGGMWLESGPPAESPGIALLPADGKLSAGSRIVAESLATERGRPIGGRVEPMTEPANWITAPAAFGFLERSAAEAMRVRLSGSQPAVAALDEMAADPRSENRIAAAETLAVLGDYAALVDLLAAEEPPRRLSDTQWNALERSSVPLALARGAEHAEAFLEAVRDALPRDVAKIVEKMSAGFSDADLAAGGDRALVEGLAHPSLIVRRFAAERLAEIVSPPAADRLRFRPDGPSEPRADAVKWWGSRLEKGLVRRPPAGGLSKGAAE